MSGPCVSEWLGELRDLLHDVMCEAEDSGYGYFPGGDPRTFTPDEECCTAEEIQRWKDDCARAERGEKPTTKTVCQHVSTGGVEMIVTPSGYGVGTYTMENPYAKEIADRLDRIVGQIEAWARDGEDGDQ